MAMNSALADALGLNLPIDYGPGRGAVGGGSGGSNAQRSSLLRNPNQGRAEGGLNGGAGGGSGAGTAAPNLGAGVNTAQTNPVLDDVINRMQGRLSGDMGTGDAARRMAQEMRDNSEGIQKQYSQKEARQGTLGSGASALNTRKIASDTLANILKGTADINARGESEKNALLASLANVGTAQMRGALDERDFALRQAEMINANRRADQQAAQARQLAILQMLGGLAT
jgi:hypothetical protein